MNLNPVTLKKLKRFKSIKRGYYSFVIFSVLVVISLLAELLVNSRALAVSYQGELYFPTYGDVIPGQHFGLDYEYETNYRQLKSQFAKEDKGDWVLLPLVPWNPYEQDFKEEAYPPYAPSLAERHFLGTDTSGRDVLARLVYGFRIAIGFAFIALVASYVIGVSIGCMMGFLGGRFDLLMQRFIEIWSQVPFLYVIMILVSWPSRTSACSSASTCCSAGWGSPGTCAPSPTRSGRGTT
jgi:microcin C transport system permease protein